MFLLWIFIMKEYKDLINEQSKLLIKFKKEQEESVYNFLEKKLNELPDYLQDSFWVFMDKFCFNNIDNQLSTLKDSNNQKVEVDIVARWVYELIEINQIHVFFSSLYNQLTEEQKKSYKEKVDSFSKYLKKVNYLHPETGNLKNYIYAISEVIDIHYLFSYCHNEIPKYEYLNKEILFKEDLLKKYNEFYNILEF